MKFFKSIYNSILLFLGLICYYIFALIAISTYSGGFNIWNDLWTHLRWYGYNPEGALFFRIGNITYSISVVLFFTGFHRWLTQNKERRLLIILAQIDGFLAGILMILSEIFADIDEVFFITSGLSLLLLIIFLILSIFSLYRQPKFWKPSIIIFVISIGFSIYLLYLGITDAPIVEFRIIDFLVTIFNQCAICLIAINMLIIQLSLRNSTINIK